MSTSKIGPLYHQVFRPLADKLAEGVKAGLDPKEIFDHGSIRQQFLHEVVNRTDNLKMTKAGAASYFQMMKKRHRGEDMYTSHKKYNTKQATANKTDESTVIEDQPSKLEAVVPNVDRTLRWFVGDEQSKTIFASFKTRTAAQEHNKKLADSGVKSNWIDGNKVDTTTFVPTHTAL